MFLLWSKCTLKFIGHFWMHGSSRKAPPYEYQTQRSGHCCSRRCGKLWWFVLDLIATAPCPSSHPTERSNLIWSNLVIGFIHFSGVSVDTPNGNSKQKRIKAMHWQHSFLSNCNIKLSFRTLFFIWTKVVVSLFDPHWTAEASSSFLVGRTRPMKWWAMFPWECQARFWNECLAISCNLNVCQPWGMTLYEVLWRNSSSMFLVPVSMVDVAL